MNALITLRVPATSANLGSGFDTIGMAVSLYNIFKVTELLPEGEYKVEALGEGARELSSPKANLVVKAYEETCERWNVKGPGFALWCHNIIPLCRGLGSSAGAVVAGVLIAKYLTGYDADDDELLRAMTMIEGHPDNVAPCFLGGMVVSCWDGKELRYVNLPPLPPEVLCVVAVPDERVKTSDARNALPKEVPFGDAVFNVGRAALLTAAWATGKWDYLKPEMGNGRQAPPAVQEQTLLRRRGHILARRGSAGMSERRNKRLGAERHRSRQRLHAARRGGDVPHLHGARRALAVLRPRRQRAGSPRRRGYGVSPPA